jgi:hypothetical protein
MGIIFELEESDFSGYIDEGEVYNAQITNVRLREKPFKDERTGQPVKRVEFAFKLSADDGHDGQDIWGDTSTRFNDHPDCRLRAWSEAILGMHLPPHFKLDTDTLIDRRCRVIIGKKEWEKDGETRTRNFVREVHPTREAALALADSINSEPF